MSITFFLGVAQTSESTQILGLECMGGLNKMSWGGGANFARNNFFCLPLPRNKSGGGEGKNLFWPSKKILRGGGVISFRRM